jgi:uncharacterized protein (TIGR02594 family)
MTPTIRSVQKRLAALGFDPGPIDGIRGPLTDAAIVAFKRSIGFRARPYLGPLTTAALFDRSSEDTELPWMAEAAKVRGLHERRDERRLEVWMRAILPRGSWWTSSRWIDVPRVPWCGLFVATCLRAAYPRSEMPANPLSARAWSTYGISAEPAFGAMLVFSRPGGGHVGFCHGEDETAFHVLGGNQSNTVNVRRIAKSRHIATRWPVEGPVPGGRVLLAVDGRPLSTNEA